MDKQKAVDDLKKKHPNAKVVVVEHIVHRIGHSTSVKKPYIWGPDGEFSDDPIESIDLEHDFSHSGSRNSVSFSRQREYTRMAWAIPKSHQIDYHYMH